MLGDRGLNWHALADNYDLIRARIERVIPGFENYNERVRTPEGFYLPNGARERQWKTPNGKANFSVHCIEPLPLADDELLMMTIRSHDQYNTTIYGMDDRYRGVYGERRVIFINAADLKARDLQTGDRVDITSEFNGQTRVAPLFIAVEYDIPRGCAATYFPETNVLVALDDVADQSNTPASKSVKIRVTRRAD